MALAKNELIKLIRNNKWSKDVFKGRFGLEKENVRVDKDGRLALTPHPEEFGSKIENPYIKTDFSESQVEMITPVYNTIEEAYSFLEALHNIVVQQLHEQDEYLWTSSNPPILPQDEDIPIARLNDPFEDEYRFQLAQKYGRKKQLLSGIHYNFSFDEELLKKIYAVSDHTEGYMAFKNSLYLKVARNLLKYRWLLIYLTGASPVFGKTYFEPCVAESDHFDAESRFYPNMNSLRNSMCGYRNIKPLYVSFNSVEDYVHDLKSHVDNGELIHVKEFYSPVRLKSVKGKDQIQGLLDHGVDYLELRMLDLNPLYKNGVSLKTLQFIHLVIIYMLLKEDEPFSMTEQSQADQDVDVLMMEGLQARTGTTELATSMEEAALAFLNSMGETMKLLQPDNEALLELLEDQRRVIKNPNLSFASIVKAQINDSSYIVYHLNKAKDYAKQSIERGYTVAGFEDMELSTQLLIKAAIKRGISFEILDRSENFIVLQKGDHKEYIKQATKTSLDSYSTVLLMENKIVTKEVLSRQKIRVPEGKSYTDLQAAMLDFKVHTGSKIVIKPKSTNFGLGITIFLNPFSKKDFQQALEMAFKYDTTVMVEEFITGKEYRFLVMGNEVVGILQRVPANIVGDGANSIEQLIRKKNLDPLRGKGYKTPLEWIQLGETEKMFLRNQSLSPLDIPEKNKLIYLRENSNISTGGDSIDYTDEVCASYKQIAIKAAKAVNATFCGVDMMIEDITEEATDQNYCIIELNFNPAIHIHCYPYQGKNRKADDKILDLLFYNQMEQAQKQNCVFLDLSPMSSRKNST
ncbi:Glutathione biosynthesis bifunctional protein GshAB [compost metagenome]